MTSSVSSYNFRAITPLAGGYTVAELNARLAVLQENLQAVGNLMEVVNAGSSLLGFNAVVSANAEVGQPLYFDPADKVFKPSYLAIVESAGRLYAGPSSEAWVLLLDKCDDERGTVLFEGLATVDLTQSAGAASPSGKFYLSEDAGKLTASPPTSLLVPVLLATGDGQVLFRPWFADTFPRYFPKLIGLTTGPAGTVASSGATFYFTSTNAAAAGWLPASHTVFGGHKPVGAMLGYNWKADPNLADIWPPLAPGECELLIDSGGNESKGYHVLPGNDSSRLLITEYGIWWMSACTEQAPWNVAADGLEGQSSCPKSFPRQIQLRADFASTAALPATSVGSLSSKVDWLKLYKHGTENEASYGELDLAIDAVELVSQTDDTTGLAFKAFADGKFSRGPVVTSIIPKSAAIKLTGGSSLAATPDGTPQYGSLLLDIDLARSLDVLPMDAQLTNATTEAYGDTVGFGLRAGVLSRLMQVFRVNSSVAAENLRFYFWLLAPQSLSLPAGLTVEVAKLAAPGTGTGSLGAYTDAALSYTSGQALTQGQYLEVKTGPIAVSGGDILYARITRQGQSDAVASNLIVINSYGKFEPAV